MYNMTPIKSSTMYVPQDEHLQPEECNIIIRDLKEVTMQACTRKERLARTAKNRENTNKRQADRKKTVKLETCFEYLDTRDDYSVMMMMIFFIFRRVTLTYLLLRSPSFMSNARG